MINALAPVTIREQSSFRDPSGFVFFDQDRLYRQINTSYRSDYDHLIASGLYRTLVEQKLLVPHIEVDAIIEKQDNVYKIIQPDFIPFISYPYEWCFSQYRDAALLTLKIQKIALQYGMRLKDASAYNIQFLEGKPIFIDTLSFEININGQPWLAYSQFCQHFLAPLALMYHKNFHLGQLMRVFIDGLPLDFAASLLPKRSIFNFGLLVHIHIHAKFKKKCYHKENQTIKDKDIVSQNALYGMINSLEATIKKLRWHYSKTEWADYYNQTNYNAISFQHKETLLKNLITKIRPTTVWDLGANTGHFSRIIAESATSVISFDIDPNAIEFNYQQVQSEDNKSILPLYLDLRSPSPAIGWANEERTTLIQRSNADTVVALALIHHLAISNNIPLNRIARYMASLAMNLIIEFVPKEDSQAQKLLASRKDIFVNYYQKGFENAFLQYYEILESHPIDGTMRRLYLMKRYQ